MSTRQVKAFGLTFGIFWAIVVTWCVLLGLIGKGQAPYEFISTFYLGWIALSWAGLVFGAIIGFIDGLVFGLLFAWVYNKIAK